MADNSFFDEEGSIEFVNNEAVKTTDTIQVFAKFKNSKSRLLPTIRSQFILETKKGWKKWSYQAPLSCMTKIPHMCLYLMTTMSRSAETYPSGAWTAGGSS